MKRIGKLALIILALFGISLLFFTWYKQTYPMETAKTSRVNSPTLEHKLLIATQSSPFKDLVTAEVVDRYNSASVVVKVIDFAALKNADLSDFNAILIIHRWEAGEPPEAVRSFMYKNSSLKDRIVVLTTSWNGLEKMKDIDAITGASIVEDAPIFTGRIIKRLNPLLK